MFVSGIWFGYCAKQLKMILKRTGIQLTTSHMIFNIALVNGKLATDGKRRLNMYSFMQFSRDFLQSFSSWGFLVMVFEF